MAELVDALDSETSEKSHAGSNPVNLTNIFEMSPKILPKWGKINGEIRL